MQHPKSRGGGGVGEEEERSVVPERWTGLATSNIMG